MLYKKKIIITFLLILITPVLLLGLVRFFFSSLETEKALKSIYFKNKNKINVLNNTIMWLRG